jgi:hypothetical protein
VRYQTALRSERLDLQSTAALIPTALRGGKPHSASSYGLSPHNKNPIKSFKILIFKENEEHC